MTDSDNSPAPESPSPAPIDTAEPGPITPTPRAPRKTWAFRLFAILLPLLLIEGGSRLYWSLFIFRFSSDQEIRSERFWKGKWQRDREDLPFVFSRGMTGNVANTPTRINNLGFRGNEDIDLRRPYRGLRITCIGDSVTFGYCVTGNSAAYPAVLERQFRDIGVPCQVINGGMPRYRVEHMANLFDKTLAVHKSRVIVILGGWNDINDNILRSRADRQSNAIQSATEMLYMFKVAADFKKKGWLGSFRPPAVILPEGFVNYRNGLERLIATARKAGSTPYLCTLPNFFSNLDSQKKKEKAALFSPRGTLSQITLVTTILNDSIREVARVQKIPLIECCQINSVDLFEDAIHPNDAGSKAIAKVVFNRLRADLLKKSR
jgi:lysophospholipase L1-like esterase